MCAPASSIQDPACHAVAPRLRDEGWTQSPKGNGNAKAPISDRSLPAVAGPQTSACRDVVPRLRDEGGSPITPFPLLSQFDVGCSVFGVRCWTFDVERLLA